MNWFLKHITAQIWEIQQDSFVEALEAFYELEYKMQALERWKFKGLPQRKENILNNLRKNLLITANSLKNTLSIVFKEWLSHHAITNPEEWDKELEQIGVVIPKIVKEDNLKRIHILNNRI